MRGRLGYNKWRVYVEGSKDYYAERTLPDGTQEVRLIAGAHCLACAKVDVLSRWGGRVDLRGHHTTMCDAFLLVMQAIVEAERKG